MERLREPRPGEDEPLEGKEQAAPRERATLRCPYCHDAVPAGPAASACVACGTVHHVSCFAEHRGCSTHGCGASEAVSLGDAPADCPRVECARCKVSLDYEASVVQCARCGRVQHPRCYEESERCAHEECRGGPSRVLTLREAVRRAQRQWAWALTIAAAIVPILVLGHATVILLRHSWTPSEVLLNLVLGLFLASPGLLLGWAARRRWRRVAALGGPSAPPRPRTPTSNKDAPDREG